MTTGPGIPADGQVIYELHVGTFTPEGTWRAAAAELEALADLGITIVEMMPVADFAGRFGWGYDGVDLYAPTRLYGTPDDLRAFVDRAHALGLGVILDVVYNHIGPDGNYLSDFAREYFTGALHNDWGEALNFETSPPARAFFVENAGYWIDEFHLDGLRLDATQDIHDISRDHVVSELIREARAEGRLSRHLRRRRERAAGDPSRSRSGAGRPRRRRALERRLSPHGGRRADRKAGSLLLRLQRLRAGVPVLREVRLSLSGPVVPLAEEAPRNAGPRTSRRAPSSATSRITIRWRIRRSAGASTRCARRRACGR
jgi:hypothetical protein